MALAEHGMRRFVARAPAKVTGKANIPLGTIDGLFSPYRAIFPGVEGCRISRVPDFNNEPEEAATVLREVRDNELICTHRDALAILQHGHRT